MQSKTLQDKKIEFFQKLSPLFLSKSYSIEKATEHPEMVNFFYDLATYLTKKLPLRDHTVPFFISNFTAKYSSDITIKTIPELLDYFNTQKQTITRKDIPYSLGFRSIYFILNENFKDIQEEDIEEVNNRLQIFYTHHIST